MSSYYTIEQLEKNKTLGDRGIIYIVFGKEYVKEAIFSAESVKRFSPGIPIIFFTDNPNMLTGNKFVDGVIPINPQHQRAKVDYIGFSPFKNTIYLDSDTCIVRDISDMFDILEKFDIAGIHDFARKREKYSKLVPDYSKIPYGFSEINGGVFAFKRGQKTCDFFNLWRQKFYENYQKTNGWDQISLRIALWQSNLSLYVLPIEYNVRGKDNRAKLDLPQVKADNGKNHLKPRILHMHAAKNDKLGKVKSIHQGKYDIETFEEFYNYCINNYYRY